MIRKIVTIVMLFRLAFAIDSVSGAASRSYKIKGFRPDVKLPSVSFLKAPGFMDGHAAYSDPLLEQPPIDVLAGVHRPVVAQEILQRPLAVAADRLVQTDRVPADHPQ